MQLLRGLVLLWLTALAAGAQFDFSGATTTFGRKRPVRAQDADECCESVRGMADGPNGLRLLLGHNFSCPATKLISRQL